MKGEGVCMRKPLFYNNERKYAGKPLRRKKTKGKRWHTRKECEESLDALMEYWNQ